MIPRSSHEIIRSERVQRAEGISLVSISSLPNCVQSSGSQDEPLIICWRVSLKSRLQLLHHYKEVYIILVTNSSVPLLRPSPLPEEEDSVPLATVMVITLLVYLGLMLVLVMVMHMEMVRDSLPVCEAACEEVCVSCSQCCMLDCRCDWTRPTCRPPSPLCWGDPAPPSDCKCVDLTLCPRNGSHRFDIERF